MTITHMMLRWKEGRHETIGGLLRRSLDFAVPLQLWPREINPYHVQINRIRVGFHRRDRLHYIYDPPILTVALDGVTGDEFFYLFIFVDFFLAFRGVVVIQDTFHRGLLRKFGTSCPLCPLRYISEKSSCKPSTSAIQGPARNPNRRSPT